MRDDAAALEALDGHPARVEFDAPNEERVVASARIKAEHPMAVADAFAIAARLDGLSTDEKSVLQDAAVLGTTAQLGALCALGERDRTATPGTDAAHALAERRYRDAAAILDSIPSIPLRDAALRLADA